MDGTDPLRTENACLNEPLNQVINVIVIEMLTWDRSRWPWVTIREYVVTSISLMSSIMGDETQEDDADMFFKNIQIPLNFLTWGLADKDLYAQCIKGMIAILVPRV